MDRPFPAYQGDEPYVFVSYSHSNSSAVYPELIWLKDCRFNVWYDEGIEVGTDWSDELAARIEKAKLFLYFVTPESAKSKNCRNEVSFALQKEISILAIHLEKTELPGGLALNLSARQAILKHELPDQEYRDKLRKRIATCLGSGEGHIIAAAVPSFWRRIAANMKRGKDNLFYGGQPEEESPNQEGFDWASAFSMVVFPFEFTTRDPEIEAISIGLSDVIMQQLTQKQSCALEPICERIKISKIESQSNISESAFTHNVNYVLRGNIQQDGQVIQIRAHLVRSDNSNVWSQFYKRLLNDADVFTLQSEVANSIAEHCAVWLGFDLLKLHASQHPALAAVTPDALELFLKAREQDLLINTGEGGDYRIQQNYLKKSVEADPQFASAFRILSQTYTHRSAGVSITEATNNALSNIEKAVLLNPSDPQNLLQAGQVHMLMTLDYRKADKLLQKGMEQYPDFGWFPAELAMIAARERRTTTALRLMSIAARIPFHFEQANFQFNYAWLLFLCGHYELSLTESSRGLELAPGGAARADLLSVQWVALIELGRIEEARPLIEEAWKLDGAVIPESYIAAYANTNQETRAREILTDLQLASVNQYFLATGYLSLGDVDETFKAINAAIENHNGLMVDSLKFEKFWESIRLDPRFKEALKRLEQKEKWTHAGEQARTSL